MAVVQGLYSYSLLDAQGVRASARFPFQATDTETLASAKSGLTTFGGLLDAVTGAEITGSHISINTGAMGKDSPVADCLVEEMAVFNYANGATAKHYGAVIPAIRDTLVTGNRIDLANADVAALTAALIAATGSAGVFTNDAYQALTALVDAFLSFRKRRRQLHALSIERP